MIERIPFGATGHASSRTIFGAAGLARSNPREAAATLELLLERGVNHIDVAASYGIAEDLVGPWMDAHRDRFFLATKTGERRAEAALEQLEASRRRLHVDQIDLWQLHNLTGEDDWAVAFAPGGVIEAARHALEKGWVRHVGVTGHGTRVASMHLRSLERFDFASVLLPYNYAMMSQPDYADAFERLVSLCEARRVAVQTIKSVARRRWEAADRSARSWYEPLRDPEALERAVRFVLGRPGLFLNTSSDLALLPRTLDVAAGESRVPSAGEMDRDVALHGIQPLFLPGLSRA